MHTGIQIDQNRLAPVEGQASVLASPTFQRIYAQTKAQGGAPLSSPDGVWRLNKETL